MRLDYAVNWKMAEPFASLFSQLSERPVTN